ncbi:hypothetical protein H7F33_07025 [Pedobacter sp. PAMC26386]|nr:hypothetical protein H7F33_07025 [Pedobacter sp. PAMC26386]
MQKRLRVILIVYLSLINTIAYSQSKSQYLKNNRFDFNLPGFEFPQNDFKLIGYGAFHGSQATEKGELILLESLLKNRAIHYYLPETDFSIAHYFNEYLKSGDTVLLKKLVVEYGKRSPQEKTIETYNKWKSIKRLNDSQPDNNKLEVIGVDLLVSYRYASKQLVTLLTLKNGAVNSVDQLREMVQIDTTSYSMDSSSYAMKVLKAVVDDYEQHKSSFRENIKSKVVFDHIINNLKWTFDTVNPITRDLVMFNNYTALSEIYSFKTKPQFVRMGFFHLEKARDENIPSFFTTLIEKGIYKKEEIISVLGYLSESRVLWDVIYDKNGHYSKYTTEGGMGIGNYWKEYFKGISRFERNKVSDLTLFRLNRKNSIYSKPGTDLIEVKLFLKKSNQAKIKSNSTTDYLDYALLISNSNASIPIEELK